jgi:hypothetical protein
VNWKFLSNSQHDIPGLKGMESAGNECPEFLIQDTGRLSANSPPWKSVARSWPPQDVIAGD